MHSTDTSWCVLIAGPGSRRRGFSTELNRLLPSCRLHSNEFDILTSSWNRSPGTTIIRESGLRFLERSQDGGREVECFLCYPSSIPPASVYWVLVIKEAWVRVWGIWWSARQLKSLPLVRLQFSCNIYLKLDTVHFSFYGSWRLRELNLLSVAELVLKFWVWSSSCWLRSLGKTTYFGLNA